MKGTARFGLGAAAGLMVYACDLYLARMEHILYLLPRSEYLPYLAAAIGGIPFMAVGGFVAALQGSAARPLRLLGFGMLLPALFLAWNNGRALGIARSELYQTADPRAATTSISTPWERPAFAGDAKILPSPRSEGLRISLMRAITGIERKRTWYVVAGATRGFREAMDLAAAINESGKQFRADVYRPYGENPFFKVVLGAELPFRRAVVLRDKAIQGGIQFEPRLIYHRK